MSGPITFKSVSKSLGVALVLAGALTAYEALHMASEFSTSPWPHFAGGVGEIAFGLGLLVGLYPRILWYVLVACFFVFLNNSLDRVLSGESSCGCFGRFQVHPWYTSVFDAMALVALACVHAPTPQLLDPKDNRRRWIVYTSLLTISLIGLGLSAFPVKARGTLKAAFAELSREAKLPPADWVGQRFPLAPHIDVGQQLMEDHWALMLFHSDCSLCRRTLPQFIGLAYHLAHQDRLTRVALIEVPRNGTSPSAPSQDSSCLRGRLSADHTWHIPSPTFVMLNRGVVTKVSDQLDAVYRDLGVLVDDRDPQSGGDLFPDYRRLRRETFLREIACGPLALMRVLEAFGIPLSEVEAEQLVNEAGEKGIDMFRLRQLAEEHGLHAIGVAASPEMLRRFGYRAIVLLDGVGFVPVLEYTPAGVVVAYPLSPAGLLPDDLFAKSFGSEGKALLLSDKPLTATGLGLPVTGAKEKAAHGPRLRLNRSLIAIGRLHRRNWEASLRLTNDGHEPLEIKGVQTTCACLTASVEERILAPAQTTRLQVKGIQDQLGSFRYAVVLQTNEAAAPSLQIPVRGFLEQPVAFSPPVVMFRKQLPEAEAEVEVQLEMSRRVNPSDLRLNKSRVGSFTGELSCRQQTAVLKVRWLGVKEVGIHHGEFEVITVDDHDAVAATLLCAAEVVAGITAFPPSLWLDRVRDQWTRQVIIDSKRDLVGTPSAHWSDESAGERIQVRFTKIGSRSLRVNLGGKIPPQPERLALTVLVDGQSVVIPILVQRRWVATDSNSLHGRRRDPFARSLTFPDKMSTHFVLNPMQEARSLLDEGTHKPAVTVHHSGGLFTASVR